MVCVPSRRLHEPNKPWGQRGRKSPVQMNKSCSSLYLRYPYFWNKKINQTAQPIVRVGCEERIIKEVKALGVLQSGKSWLNTASATDCLKGWRWQPSHASLSLLSQASGSLQKIYIYKYIYCWQQINRGVGGICKQPRIMLCWLLFFSLMFLLPFPE